MLANAGAERLPAPAGLLETVAASGGYALEGAVLVSGAAIQWLRDGLGIIAAAEESERLARSVESTRRRLVRPGPRPASARRTGTRMRAG